MTPSPRRARGALRLGLLCACLLAAAGPSPRADAPEPDWDAIAADAATLLSGYIQLDTTNPPGNESVGARYLQAFLEGEGIETRIVAATPGRGNLIARLPATVPEPEAGPLLLLSHIDVVPADPEAWSFPPLSGAIENGHVYGRGALDDKGHGVAQALALVLLARSEAPRARDVYLAATAGEEAGAGVGADFLVDEHWEALGPPVAVWNEGGVSTPNPLGSGELLNAIATTEKRALWLTLVAQGEGGHGSTPVRDGANERLVAALSRIHAHETSLHVVPTVAEAMHRLSGTVSFPQSLVMDNVANPLVLAVAGSRLTADRVTNALLRDTIAVTGLRSGVKHNVIPRRAEATLDVRLLPDTDAETFLAGLREVVGDPSVEITGVPDPLPAILPESPPDHPVFRAIEAEMVRELPGSVTTPMLTTGGTDSLWFRAQGVPSYGYIPAVLPSELVSSMHGVDERIPIAELGRAVRVTYRTLQRLTALD